MSSTLYCECKTCGQSFQKKIKDTLYYCNTIKSITWLQMAMEVNEHAKESNEPADKKINFFKYILKVILLDLIKDTARLPFELTRDTFYLLGNIFEFIGDLVDAAIYKITKR